MSSFIVNAEHIAEITKHYIDLPYVSKTFYNPTTKKQIKLDWKSHNYTKEIGDLPLKTILAVMLANGNLKSVNHRYKNQIDIEHDKEFMINVGKETLKPKDYKLSYAELINMCQCLNYQNMDAENYDGSNESYIIEQIKNAFASRWADVETDGDENKIRWSYPN